MTIEVSGAISLGTAAGANRSISGEFGGTTPHSLSEYYEAAAGVPASPDPLDFSDFYGTSAVTVSLLKFDAVAATGAPTFGYAGVDEWYCEQTRSGNCDAGIRFGSNGLIYVITNGPTYTLPRSPEQEWVTPTTEAANYYVKGTASAGTFSTSPGAGYVALTSNRDYYVSRSTIGAKDCTGTFYISTTASDVGIVDSIAFSFLAEEEK